MPQVTAEIYTDGSCHTQYRTGTWVAIVFLGTAKEVLSGLPVRREKIVSQKFTTQKGNALQNADLVAVLFELLSAQPVVFIKVKAHQKQGNRINYNMEADMLCRQLLRGAVKKMFP